MRILFLSNYYPPHEVGGYEQLCRDVAVRLADRGHPVAVLTSDKGVEDQAPANEPGIYRLLRHSPDYGRQMGVAVQFFVARRRDEAHNRRCLRQVAGQFAPDVVFVWNLQRLPRCLALEAEALLGVATAYWLAHYTPAEPDEYWRYWKLQARRRWVRPFKSAVSRTALSMLSAEGKPVRPQMRHVAVVSEWMRDKGLAEDTLPAHASVIYNGVELDTFQRPVQDGLDAPLCLLFAGRVSEDKGVHTAVEAVGHLVYDYAVRNVHLTVAGAGPDVYRQALEEIVQRYGIEGLVRFQGRLPRNEIPELMSRCQVLLLPSIYPEAFSRVVLEAMAGGLVVVGTLVGGTGELLQQGVTGLVFAPEDSRDLAAQIHRQVVEPGLRQRLATEGQQQVLERFSLETMVDNLEGLLERARSGSQAGAMGSGGGKTR